MTSDGSEYRFWVYADTANENRYVSDTGSVFELRLNTTGQVAVYTKRTAIGYTANAYTAVGTYAVGLDRVPRGARLHGRHLHAVQARERDRHLDAAEVRHRADLRHPHARGHRPHHHGQPALPLPTATPTCGSTTCAYADGGIVDARHHAADRAGHALRRRPPRRHRGSDRPVLGRRHRQRRRDRLQALPRHGRRRLRRTDHARQRHEPTPTPPPSPAPATTTRCPLSTPPATRAPSRPSPRRSRSTTRIVPPSGFDGTFETGTDGASLTARLDALGTPQNAEYDNARAKNGTLSGWIVGPTTAAAAGASVPAVMTSDGAEYRFWMYADTANENRYVSDTGSVFELRTDTTGKRARLHQAHRHRLHRQRLHRRRHLRRRLDRVPHRARLHGRHLHAVQAHRRDRRLDAAEVGHARRPTPSPCARPPTAPPRPTCSSAATPTRDLWVDDVRYSDTGIVDARPTPRLRPPRARALGRRPSRRHRGSDRPDLDRRHRQRRRHRLQALPRHAAGRLRRTDRARQRHDLHRRHRRDRHPLLLRGVSRRRRRQRGRRSRPRPRRSRSTTSPRPTPAGLAGPSAAPGRSSLSWTANTETDLAGYDALPRRRQGQRRADHARHDDLHRHRPRRRHDLLLRASRRSTPTATRARSRRGSATTTPSTHAARARRLRRHASRPAPTARLWPRPAWTLSAPPSAPSTTRARAKNGDAVGLDPGPDHGSRRRRLGTRRHDLQRRRVPLLDLRRHRPTRTATSPTPARSSRLRTDTHAARCSSTPSAPRPATPPTPTPPVGTYAVGWTEYRVVLDFTADTYTLSKRANATDAWTQLKSSRRLHLRHPHARGHRPHHHGQPARSARYQNADLWLDDVRFSNTGIVDPPPVARHAHHRRSTAATAMRAWTTDEGPNCGDCHAISDGHPGTPSDMHTPADVTGCTPCHNASITIEHNTRTPDAGGAFTCNTCHESTDPLVTAAIAAGNSACSACHLNADHASVHAFTAASDANASGDAGCTNSGSGCHGTDPTRATFTTYHPDERLHTRGLPHVAEQAHLHRQRRLSDLPRRQLSGRARAREPRDAALQRDHAHRGRARPRRSAPAARASATCADCHDPNPATGPRASSLSTRASPRSRVRRTAPPSPASSATPTRAPTATPRCLPTGPPTPARTATRSRARRRSTAPRHRSSTRPRRRTAATAAPAAIPPTTSTRCTRTPQAAARSRAATTTPCRPPSRRSRPAGRRVAATSRAGVDFHAGQTQHTRRRRPASCFAPAATRRPGA